MPFLEYDLIPISCNISQKRSSLISCFLIQCDLRQSFLSDAYSHSQQLNFFSPV